ncbi:hypothetical protein NKG94_01310 [Micromonospora sp. M12]
MAGAFTVGETAEADEPLVMTSRSPAAAAPARNASRPSSKILSW